MKVIKEFDNKLLKRKELEFTEEADSVTLSRQQVKAVVAKKYKADESLVIVNKIDSKFGSKLVKVEAYVYEDEEMLKKATLKHIYTRNNPPKEEAEE